MSDRDVSRQAVSGQTARANGRTSPPSGSVNAAYSAELLQHLVDQASYFNLHSTPDANGRDVAIRRRTNNKDEVIGVRVHELLRRFNIRTYPATDLLPWRATNTVGEVAGKFTHCWMFIPDDFVAQPGCEPPPTAFNPEHSQRFVMLNAICKLGNGDGFSGFGTGKTYPATAGRRSQLLVTAIGTLVKGFGKFKEHHECTYVYCGTFDVHRGFTGSLMIRVMDSQGTFRTTRTLPALRPEPDPEPDITYILLRGQASPTDIVAPLLGPAGEFLGMKVEQGVTVLSVDASYKGFRGLQSATRLGPFIGKLSADIVFDPMAPGGTWRDPIPFTATDTLTFPNSKDNPFGSFVADLVEGRVFNLEIPKRSGLKAIRFGGTGPLRDGTGVFKGIEGLMTDNSVVMFMPHVSASVYVLRINDPDGKYHASPS
jgi:hypothetical protein